MENDLSVLHTGRMEFVENTPEICRFCLDTKSVQKHSSDAELIDLNIPHLYEVVTNKQVIINFRHKLQKNTFSILFHLFTIHFSYSFQQLTIQFIFV